MRRHKWTYWRRWMWVYRSAAGGWYISLLGRFGIHLTIERYPVAPQEPGRDSFEDRIVKAMYPNRQDWLKERNEMLRNWLVSH